MELKRVTGMTCICMLIFLSGVKVLWAGVSISPAFIQVSLDKKSPAGRFIIGNTGTETERYRITASHFIFSDNGKLLKKEPDGNSLATWLRFNPKEFSLPPKKKRAIRYVIAPKGSVESKEYWGFMELRSLKVNAVSAKDKDGRSMKLTIVPSIIVPIFATKGNVSYSATLGDTRVIQHEKGLDIISMVKNVGQGHFFMTGNYEMVDSSGRVIQKGELGKYYILPGGQRKFKGIINTQILKGDYMINLAYSAPTLKGLITGKIQFSR